MCRRLRCEAARPSPTRSRRSTSSKAAAAHSIRTPSSFGPVCATAKRSRFCASCSSMTNKLPASEKVSSRALRTIKRCSVGRSRSDESARPISSSSSPSRAVRVSVRAVSTRAAVRSAASNDAPVTGGCMIATTSGSSAIHASAECCGGRTTIAVAGGAPRVFRPPRSRNRLKSTAWTETPTLPKRRGSSPRSRSCGYRTNVATLYHCSAC